MSEIHRLVATSVILYFALLGIWGLVLALRKSELSSAYRGALTIGVLLGGVQALIGVLLVVTGRQPRDPLHYLYGLLVVGTIPLVQQYLSTRKFSKVLGFGLASVFTMGLAIRALTTGA